MAKRKDDSLDELFDVLKDSPWWVSLLVGAISYAIMRFAFPMIWPDEKSMSGMLAGIISQVSWVSAIFIVPAIVSVFRSARKRRMLDRQNGIESIRALSWKQLEELLGEAYRRQGYTVFENSRLGADGGVDVTLKKDGAIYLVQAKHWKTYKVGVKVVREMLGLVTAHKAAGAIVVTSGRFTKEAIAFAANQSVELVDGDALMRLVAGVQSASRMVAQPQMSSARTCSKCGSALVLRQAKRGPNAGGQFWGCEGYPQCRHTEPFAG